MARILVVDDDELFLTLYDELLTDQGHEVVQARSGQAALNAVRNRVPDLIVMDLNMPEMTGFEAIRKLRDTTATARTPILAITGEETAHVYEEVYDAGADGCLNKPLEAERLITRIGEMLAS